jgi:hypothetical protein
MRFAGKRADVIVTALLLVMWLAVVIFTTARHEYWRDEVRAWSLARAAQSPLDLFHLIRYEGHPILWYLILYLGHSIVDSPLVLPIASIAIACAAVVLFMLRSPFPLWLKALFLFSGLPLYEYSVMARNYGISMLLLFLTASLYRHRTSQWLPLAVGLAPTGEHEHPFDHSRVPVDGGMGLGRVERARVGRRSGAGRTPAHGSRNRRARHSAERRRGEPPARYRPDRVLLDDTKGICVCV